MMSLLVTEEREKEFWMIIEETFVQVEAALTAYPAETREEALAGTLRDGIFKDTSPSFIRYRGVREDLDSHDSLHWCFGRPVGGADRSP
jgi:hypothetical protein